MADEQIEMLRTAKGARPRYFADPACDRILAIVMALAGEVSMLRDRLTTMEKLCEKAGTFTDADIEDYEPSEEEHHAREDRRAEYLARVFQVVQEGIDDLKQSHASASSNGSSAEQDDG